MTDDAEEHRPRRGDVGALWERVEAHGAAIRSLTVEVSDQFRDLRADNTAQISQLASNVADQIRGSNANIEKIANKLDTNAQALAESSKPRYNALFGGMIAAVSLSITIVAGLSTLHDRPYDEKLNGLRDAIGDLTKNTSTGFGDIAKNTVSQREYTITQDFLKQLAEARIAGRDAVRAGMQRDIDTLGNVVKQVDAKVVPRDEFVVRWAAEEKRDAQIEAEIANTNRRLDGLTPPGDYLRNLGERQHDLELKVYGEHR